MTPWFPNVDIINVSYSSTQLPPGQTFEEFCSENIEGYKIINKNYKITLQIYRPVELIRTHYKSV